MQQNKKVAIITGGSSGIGASIARTLSLNNYNLVISYLSNIKKAQEIANECKQNGASTILVKADIADVNDCQKIVDSCVNNFKKVDVLVNNAAITKFTKVKSLNDLSSDDFQRIYAVNTIGAYILAQKTTPYMQSGSIINISSTSSISGIGSSVAYACSKAALNVLTVALSKILSPTIRVNAVCPGFVDTTWWLQYFNETDYETFKNSQREKSSLKRVTQSDEVAEAVLFLINNKAITGEILRMDSGYKS